MAVKAADRTPKSPGPPRVILTKAVEEMRSRDLQRRTSYYRCTQHKTKPYHFDGRMAVEFGEGGWVWAEHEVPMAKRQPSQRLDLPKVIVERLTSLVVGHNHFPTIKVEGDQDAQDYVRELAKDAALPVRMIEARNLGGAAGSVALSWGFVKGRPVVEVHMSAFLEVFEWADYERRKPGRVLKAYPYKAREWNDEGNPVEVEYWYARYWDEEVDIAWQKIPREVAKTRHWVDVPPTSFVTHGAGFCPVYWIQNWPDSNAVDGMSDYEGQSDCLDNADILLSATTQGTIINVDPTLVIKDDPGNNDGVIRKGSRYALYCKGGADYLELTGQAVKAGLDSVDRIRRFELDKASVVIPDPEKLSAMGVSGKALEKLYAPMLSKCDVLQEQYGAAIKSVLEDMLSMARKLAETPRVDDKGREYWARVKLPPKVEEIDGQINITERNPGDGEHVELAWPPYFAASWQDRKDAVGAMKEGCGGQPVVSKQTAVESLAPVLGVEDARAELRRIEEDSEAGVERAKRVMDAGAPRIQTHERDQEGEGPRDKQEAEGGDGSGEA